MKNVRYIVLGLLLSLALPMSARYFDGTEVIYIQQHPSYWEWYGNDPAAGKFAYFKKTTAPIKEQWSTEAIGVDNCDDLLQILVPEGDWDVIILTRNSVHSNPDWSNVYSHGTSESNQSVDITIHATQNYLKNFRQLKDQTADNWLWSDYFTKPSGNPTTSSSINGVAKELISVCKSAAGDPFSLQPTATAAGYEYEQKHTWFKWTGSKWKEMRYGTTWGYTNVNGLSETIGAENSHTYYFLSSLEAGKSRFIEIAVTEACQPTCEITDFGVVTSSVNAHDSTYTLDGIVAFQDATGKTLRISVTDAKGEHYVEYNSPTTPFIFSLPNLFADGTTGMVATASFGEESSRTSTPYDAPNAITGITVRNINITQGVDTSLIPSTPGTDGFKWNDGNTTDHVRAIPAYGFDTTIIYTYYEYENPPEVGGNLIQNGNFSAASFDYGTPAYTQAVTGSKISDYNYWGKDVATTGNFYNDYKDGDQFLSGGMSIVQDANAFWRRFTKQITSKNGDHFALFDADNSGERAAWKVETSATQPNLKLAKGTNYMFSFWVANINNYGEMNNAAKLQFEISYSTNGGSTWSTPEKLGNPIDLNEYPDNLWHQNSYVYVAAVDADKVRISVKDLNNSANPGGNDFALDDIRFQPISVVSQAIKNCERFVVTVYEAPCVFSGIQIDTLRPKCSDADNSVYSLRVTLNYDKPQGALTLTDNDSVVFSSPTVTEPTQKVIVISNLKADGATHTLKAVFSKPDAHGVDKGCEISGTYIAPGAPALSLAVPTVPEVGCETATFDLTVTTTYAYQNGNQLLFYWDGVLHPEATKNIVYNASATASTTLTGLAVDGQSHMLTVKTNNTEYDCQDSLPVVAPVKPTVDTLNIAFSEPTCTDKKTSLTFDLNYTYQQGLLHYTIVELTGDSTVVTTASLTEQTLSGLRFDSIPADGKVRHLHVWWDGANSCDTTYTLPAVPYSPVIAKVDTNNVPKTVLCDAQDYPINVIVSTPYDATGKNIVLSYEGNTTTVAATGTETTVPLTLTTIGGANLTIDAAYEGAACPASASITFATPARISCNKLDTTICDGQTVTWMGHTYSGHVGLTDTITNPENVYDTLLLTVVALPHMTIMPTTMTCDEEADIRFPYLSSDVQGNPDSCTIVINGQDYPLTVDLSTNELVLTVNPKLEAGDYTGTVIFGQTGVTCWTDTIINFRIAIGNTMFAKWEDVIFINNKGNLYTAYQWYKDGVEMAGETQQRFYDPTGLKGTTAEYYCRMLRNDGKYIYTCPQAFDDIPRSADQSTDSQTQQQIISTYRVSPHVYIIRIQTGDRVETKKIMRYE